MFANMFILLVAPPAVGKSIAVDAMRDISAACKIFKLVPDAITRAAFIDFMDENGKSEIDLATGKWESSHPMTIISSEFGVLVPAHDLHWLNTLNNLYDCPPIFEDSTKVRGAKSIDNPSVNIISGTQPAYLRITMPENAFGLGFMSRVIMIYAGEGVKQPIFGPGTSPRFNDADLIHDLQLIGEMSGQFYWEEDAREYLNALHQEDFAPLPTHQKLQHYSGRRINHMIKLCMVKAASESGDLIVTVDHIEDALKTLHIAEELMPSIFLEMTHAGYDSALGETYDMLWREYTKEKKPIPEQKIVEFLVRLLPGRDVPIALQNLEGAGYIKNVSADSTKAPHRKFKPVAKL